MNNIVYNILRTTLVIVNILITTALLRIQHQQLRFQYRHSQPLQLANINEDESSEDDSTAEEKLA